MLVIVHVESEGDLFHIIGTVCESVRYTRLPHTDVPECRDENAKIDNRQSNQTIFEANVLSSLPYSGIQYRIKNEQYEWERETTR